MYPLFEETALDIDEHSLIGIFRCSERDKTYDVVCLELSAIPENYKCWAIPI